MRQIELLNFESTYCDHPVWFAEKNVYWISVSDLSLQLSQTQETILVYSHINADFAFANLRWTSGEIRRVSRDDSLEVTWVLAMIPKYAFGVVDGWDSFIAVLIQCNRGTVF